MELRPPFILRTSTYTSHSLYLKPQFSKSNQRTEHIKLHSSNNMTSQYGNNIESTTSGTAGSSGVGPSGGVHDSSSSKTGGIKSAIAGVHGLGEKVRGEFNAGVDKAAGEPSSEGVATAASGTKEMQTGEFSHSTKAREGINAGDRHTQANVDLNRE